MLKPGLQFRRANEPIGEYSEGSMWLVYSYGDGTCYAWAVRHLLWTAFLWTAGPLAVYQELKIFFYMFASIYLRMKGIDTCHS